MTTRVQAIVSGNITVGSLPAKPNERLIQFFTLPNPLYRKLAAFGRSTEGIQETIQVLQEFPDGSIQIPRGAVLETKNALQKDGIELSFHDHRARGTRLNFTAPPISLRKYQQEGVDRVAEKAQGIVVIGCGGGKSRLGVACIQRLAVSTIVLVHTMDLLDQWVENVRTLLGEEPGIVAAGKFNFKPITIASIDTLFAALSSPVVIEELTKFGLCIVDEAHHSPARTYQVILPCIPALYRVALTATPEREDRMTKLMDWSFGPRLIEITAGELIRMGYLVRPELEIIETGFRFNYIGPEKKRSINLTKAIVGDLDRNEKICKIAVRDVKEGEFVVILTNDRAHCRELGKRCWELGAEPCVLVGTATKAGKLAKKNSIQAMRDGKLSLIIATSLLDEGIDIARISRVILALPIKAKGTTEQKVGRAMRLFEGKRPKIYDFVDSLVETLQRRWYERRKVYRSLGMIQK